MTLPDFLTQDPDGEIRLTGHRVGLYSVVRSYQEGNPPEKIHDDLPSVPLSHIFKVLGFYLENQEAVDAYVAAYREDLAGQSTELRQGPGLEELRRRWKEKGMGALP
jgi:uncharacterized protein (DUF433 family)